VDRSARPPDFPPRREMLSEAASEIVRLRAPVWEQRLFVQVLVEEMCLEHRVALRRGYAAPGPREVVGWVDFLDWLQARIAELAQIASTIEAQFGEPLKKALGSSGLPGNAQEIVDAARALANGYEAALRWCHRVRGLQTDQVWSELLAHLGGAPGGIINGIEKWVTHTGPRLDDMSRRLAGGEQVSEKFVMTIEISFDERFLEAAVSEVRRRLRRWYVSRGGETVGPIEEGQLTAWVQGGMHDAALLPTDGEHWIGLSESPFAGTLPKGLQGKAVTSEQRQALYMLQSVWDCAKTHARVLARKFDQLTYQDDYGQWQTDRWEREVDYFAEHVVPPALSPELVGAYYNVLQQVPQFVPQIIELVVSEFQAGQESSLASEYRPEMTGPEYEVFVESILQRHGLQITRTGASGDQGVDLIAEYDDQRLAIQCKRYRSAVGNSAVQEVFAGARHYDCQLAVVVTDSSFTPAAKQLAQTSGVLLFHHDELDAKLLRILGDNPHEEVDLE
jgi:restriction system protein